MWSSRAPGWLCLALCLALGVGGCGFHLRGAGRPALTIQGVYIEGDASEQFMDELGRSLERAGATLAHKRAGARYIVNLNNERAAKNVLTVSPAGQVLEYELNYSVTFEAMDGTGRRLIGPQRIRVVRDVTFNPSTALGKANEEQRLYANLHREVIGQIITRLNSKLSQ